VKLELTLFPSPIALVGLTAAIAAAAVALDGWDRRRSRTPRPHTIEDDGAVTTLDLAGAATTS
jgi:hypothetical protein